MANKILKIVTVKNKKDAAFLRRKTDDFDFKNYDKGETEKLVKEMRETMLASDGIGLSANQIGLNARLFVVQIPDKKGKKRVEKFYAVFNPEITAFSKEKSFMEEGCLSVPGYFGEVERPDKITLAGRDINGRKMKVKAKGLLAKVFQHETDHLNGILFIDRTDKIYQIVKKQEK